MESRPYLLTHSHIMTPLDVSEKENIVGKEENVGNQHFLLFPECFLLYQRQKLSFMLHLFCRMKNAFNSDKVKFLSSWSGLSQQTIHVISPILVLVFKKNIYIWDPSYVVVRKGLNPLHKSGS